MSPPHGDDTSRTFLSQDQYGPKGLKLKYEVCQPVKELPHYRRMLIHATLGSLPIWLDKGHDMFWFEDHKKPSVSTVESYVVIEKLI
jgi:hypothetical protein